MTESKLREKDIDVLKGICIVLMIFAHTYNYGPYCEEVKTIIYSFHMPAFIFVSGYLFKKVDLKSRIGKSVRSLIRPYLITCILNIPFMMMIYKKDIFTACLSIALCYGELPNENYCSVGQMWFLGTIFFCHIIYFLISLIPSSKLQFLCCLFFSIYGIALGKKYVIPWNVDVAMAVMIIFWSGNNYSRVVSYLRRFMRGMRISWQAYQIMLWGSVYAFFEIIKQYSHVGMINLAFRKYPLGLCGLIISIIIVLLLKGCCSKFYRDFVICRFLSYIGRYSLIFLCVHTLDTWIINKILCNNTWDLLIFIVRFGLIFLISYIYITIKQCIHKRLTQVE